MKIQLARIALLLGPALGLASTAIAQVQFVPLPDNFGPRIVSADGTVALGIEPSVSGATEPRRLFRWKYGQGVTTIAQATSGAGTLPGGILAISDDGNKFLYVGGNIIDEFGVMRPQGTYLWEEGIGLTRMNTLFVDPVTTNTIQVIPTTMSRDGEVIYGHASPGNDRRLFRWDDLLVPYVPCPSAPFPIKTPTSNADGSVVATFRLDTNPDVIHYQNGCSTTVLDPGQDLPFVGGALRIKMMADGERLAMSVTKNFAPAIYIWSPLDGYEQVGSGGAHDLRYFEELGTGLTYFPYGGETLIEANGNEIELTDYYQSLGATVLGSNSPSEGPNLPATSGNAFFGFARYANVNVPSDIDAYYCVAFINEPPPGKIGSNFCGPMPENSTGLPSTLNGVGSDLLVNNDLTMEAAFLPPNQFGYLLNSRGRGFVANPAGSQGNLCLGGGQAIGRHNAASEIGFSGPSGQLTFAVNSSALPSPSGPLAAQAGETFHFQVWHRDMENGTSTSNFTDGVSITFQ